MLVLKLMLVAVFVTAGAVVEPTNTPIPEPGGVHGRRLKLRWTSPVGSDARAVQST